MIKGNENNEENKPYLNHLLSFDERVDDLLSRMTIEEKISQIFNMSTEIPRLNLPHYDWRDEALQGVAFVEKATIFPQVIGMAATFNDKLIRNVANVIADEARARYYQYLKSGKQQRWTGLTFSAPNINIVRDPRWGRGQETFGEDPYLTSRMGVAFCQGLQGIHPKYLKTSAEPKHFAVHSGPEKRRHEINIKVSKKDLYETYLPAFRACIQEGKAEGIMSSYNRVNGKPASASTFLLQDILRDEFGFKGYVISDGGAIRDIYKYHKVVKDYAEAAAMALKGGCDILNPWNLATMAKLKRHRRSVITALQKNLIDETIINRAVKRALRARFKLGMFDPHDIVPYSNTSYDIINSTKHRQFSLHTAHESVVLLKNKKNLLPLDKNIDLIAVIGPNANNTKAHYYPHYYPDTPNIVTILEGIKQKVSQETKVSYARGSGLIEPSEDKEKAIEIAKESDIIIGIFGLTGDIEGEEGYVLNSLCGDREDLKLPEVQENLIVELNEIGKPFILILTSGSALGINYAKKNVSTILQVWYSGCEGGNAVADILFGNYNPAGRLPITFYKSVEQLPDYEDYNMKGRTYRYFQGETIYSFGFGLSYTSFKYKNLDLNPSELNKNDNLNISIDIENIGPHSGDEVVQLYLEHKNLGYPVPLYELKEFKRVLIKKGESETINFTLNRSQLEIIDLEGKSVFEPGELIVYVGGCQPNDIYFRGISNNVYLQE